VPKLQAHVDYLHSMEKFNKLALYFSTMLVCLNGLLN
jgi:hypothetical protein